MNFEIVIDRPHRNAESEKLNKSEVQEKPCAMYFRASAEKDKGTLVKCPKRRRKGRVYGSTGSA